MYKRALIFLATAHCINDFLNGVIGAIIPFLTVHFSLSYLQVGALMMAANVSSSLIQPVFGFLSDKKGSPWVLPFGATALGIGLAVLPFAPSFGWLVPAVCLSGIGSAAFHPDASRAVYFAAGDRRGLAQSIFQIGGNSGMALSPLALWFLGHIGLKGTIWFMLPAVLSTVMMSTMIRWFSDKLQTYQVRRKRAALNDAEPLKLGLSLLVAVVTVRSWAVSGITTFIPLLMVALYHLTPQNVWVYSFVFLLFGALGTMVGGPLADRFGQRTLIRLSIVVSCPFAVFLPYAPHALVLPDLAILGFFLLSTFAVTVVYGQEMLPGNIAMVSGLLIGFAGGIGGIGIMVMGWIADHIGLLSALKVVVWTTPFAALCTLFLPLDRLRRSLSSRANAPATTAAKL